MKIGDLIPGDEVVIHPTKAIFIGYITPHPLYPKLSLVIWWLDTSQQYSLDALSLEQEFPFMVILNVLGLSDRESNLKKALHR